jgi:hypothetical protein
MALIKQQRESRFVQQAVSLGDEISASDMQDIMAALKQEEVTPKYLSEKELACTTGFEVLRGDEPRTGNYGYFFFKNIPNSIEYLVNCQVYTVNEEIRSVEKMVQEIEDAEKYNRALYDGCNVKKLELGIVSLGNSKCIRYWCGLFEYKKWFKDRNQKAPDPAVLFKNVRFKSFGKDE